MKSSVVIPAKNEEDGIEESLRSLLKQTERPEEIIVVDNNSSDRTFSIAQQLKEEFQKKGIQLTVLSCLRGNQIEARHMGFGTAKHELIISVDADSRLSADWIEVAKKYFVAHEGVVAIGGLLQYDQTMATIVHGSLFRLYRLFPKRYFFYGSNAAFLRSAYKKTGGLLECRALLEKYHFQEPYDDLYLSYVLKRYGVVAPVAGLKATALARHANRAANNSKTLQRTVGQFRESLFLQRYLLHETALIQSAEKQRS